MKAAVFYKPFDIRIEEVPKPTLSESDILIQVKSVSICKTDIQIFCGDSPISAPIVLGHDFSGIITAVGTHVKNFSVGERVAIQPVGYCGYCCYCRKGKYHLCLYGKWLGFEKDGGLSEYAIVNECNLLKLPNNLSFDESAVLEPVAVGLRAIKLANIQIGDYVAIIGQGSIGLMLTKICKLVGGKVLALDIDASKLKAAKEMGADHVFNVSSENKNDVIKKVSEISGGLGVNVVFEASGTQEAIDMAEKMVMCGGKIMLIGHRKNLRGPPINLEKELTIKYVGLTPIEYPLALKLISEGIVDVKRLITHHIKLKDVPRYFDGIIRGQIKAIRVIVNP